MNDEIELEMMHVLEVMEQRLSNIRAGRANPAMVNGINVEYYGTPTPLQSLANITVPEAKTLMIKPFDKSSLKNVEKAIYEADLGIAPTNNGEVIYLTVPELTEETRKNYVKQVKEMTEEAKIALRNIRQDANNLIKREEHPEDEEKMYLDEVQELTNKYNSILEDKYKEKEKELMTV